VAFDQSTVDATPCVDVLDEPVADDVSTGVSLVADPTSVAESSPSPSEQARAKRATTKTTINTPPRGFDG
jgi:hypothetical protein